MIGSDLVLITLEHDTILQRYFYQFEWSYVARYPHNPFSPSGRRKVKKRRWHNGVKVVHWIGLAHSSRFRSAEWHNGGRWEESRARWEDFAVRSSIVHGFSIVLASLRGRWEELVRRGKEKEKIEGNRVGKERRKEKNGSLHQEERKRVLRTTTEKKS